jgi:phage tail sheath gpL-like
MTISFNQIPANLRVPLFYAEFDNSRAVQGGATQEYRTLLIGNRLASGTKPALQLERITSAEQAAEYFGAGSVLADQAAAFLKINRIHPLYCIALEDLMAGVKATGKIVFTGSVPSKAGTASFMVGGRNIKIGVSLTDTATTLATALFNAINADSLCVVEATNATAGEVDLVAKNKGEFGNEIDVRHSYFAGEELPAGVVVAITAMSGGTGNPDVDTVWPVIGEDQYILMSSPYLDAQNLGKMETELAERFGPLKQVDGYAIYGKRGTFGTLITIGDTRNSQFTTIMGMRGPTNPWVWAAALAAQVANSASIDPARPFQTLVMTGVLAPSKAELFTLEERNQLLYGGIATFNVDAGGNVLIEGVITTFKENAFGSPDTSYLYLNTPLTLSYLRFDLKARITLRFPRHKLANDGTRFAPGQAVVTPNSIKAEIITKFREWEEKALVEGFDQFKSELIVERNADNPNRVDVLMPPDLVNQLTVLGVKIQFLL